MIEGRDLAALGSFFLLPFDRLHCRTAVSVSTGWSSRPSGRTASSTVRGTPPNYAPVLDVEPDLSAHQGSADRDTVQHMDAEHDDHLACCLPGYRCFCGPGLAGYALSRLKFPVLPGSLGDNDFHHPIWCRRRCCSFPLADIIRNFPPRRHTVGV